MHRSTLFVSTLVLGLIALAPQPLWSAPGHGRLAVRAYGPAPGWGFGFYLGPAPLPYRYYRYPAVPYVRTRYYVGVYPTVRYAPAVSSWQGYYPGAGAVRILVDKKDAEVFVDGYYAGIVDDFDGLFQKLYLQPGEHVIELRREGDVTFRQQILVSPDHTQKLHHEMVPAGPSEAIDEQEGEPPMATPRAPVPAPRSAPTPSPRSATPMAVTPGEFGMLRLRVQPAAGEIWIDAQPWGSLGGIEDLTIHLPAGGHHIELRRGSTVVFSTEVAIGPGETTPLNIRLTN